MSKTSEREKSRIKREIRKELEAGTFTITGFALKHSMCRKTLRRWICQDEKLCKKVTEYSVTKEKEEEARRASEAHRASRVSRGKGKGKKDSEPFTNRSVETDFADGKGKGVITTRSLDIKTIDDALRIAEVDLNIWEVERSKINSWEVTIGARNSGTEQAETFTNFQVTVWLQRKSEPVLALEELLEKIKNNSPIVPKFKHKPPLRKQPIKRELEISLADIHLGLRCFAGDSDIDWTPDMAEQMTMEILDRLIQLSNLYGPFEKIIMPFGNDFLHTDYLQNTTTSGTVQPEGDAWKNTMLRGELLAIAMIDRLKNVAPIKVISVPGNHAHHTEISMARTLNAYYHADDNVEVDAGFSTYKFHKFGVNLIGFEHGHSIRQTLRLSGLMANECRLNGWKEARYCVFHCGDQHRRGAGRPTVMQEQGVGVEFLPSLVPANSWHKAHGFNHQIRGGVAFCWDKSAGPIATLACHIDNYTGKIMG